MKKLSLPSSLSITQQISVIILICICTFFAHLSSLFPDLMECRNFVTAREMLQEGNWWYTTMNLEPRLEKPPFPTWLTAISANYLGGLGSLFALRFPAAISATLMVLFFYGFCREISKEKYFPFLAAIIMATSLLVMQQARTNTWDIYTHTFVLGSIWQLLVGIKRKKSIYILVSALLMGLSVFSKGPVSLYALWLPFLIAYSIGDKLNFVKKHYGKLISILVVGLLIGFSWRISMYLFQADNLELVLNKETAAWANRNVRPFYFYLHFPVYIGIWIVLLFSSFFYKYAAPRINQYGNYRFVISWILVTVLFLSVIPTKKERYLLPVLIPMCLAASYLLYSLIVKYKTNNVKLWDRVVFVSFTALTSIVAVVFCILILMDGNNNWQSTLAAVAIIMLGVVGLYLLLNRRVVVQVLNTVLIVIIFCVGLIPKTNNWLYNFDEFNNLSEIQKIPELSDLPYYSEAIHPRIMWLSGKALTPFNFSTFNDTTEFPIVVITLGDINDMIPYSLHNKITIESFGTYDYYRKESNWKANVFLVKLKEEIN